MLRKKGLKITTINENVENLAPVKYDWLKAMNIQTVIDAGASNGGFAGKARQLFPGAYIYSFEALELPYKQLIANFAGDDRFEAHQLVLSDKQEKITFYENDYSGSSSMLKMKQAHIDAYPFTKKVTPVELTADTLDNFFSGKKLEEKILLKMDVQGAEHLVLKGASHLLRKTDVIFTEVSFRPLYDNSLLINEIITMLEKENFMIAGIENVSQSLQDGSFLQADVFFVKK